MPDGSNFTRLIDDNLHLIPDGRASAAGAIDLRYDLGEVFLREGMKLLAGLGPVVEMKGCEPSTLRCEGHVEPP